MVIFPEFFVIPFDLLKSADENALNKPSIYKKFINTHIGSAKNLISKYEENSWIFLRRC